MMTGKREKPVRTLPSVNDLYQLYYVAAYGCNRACEQAIRQTYYKHSHDDPLFLFFEFFVDQPLLRWDDLYDEDCYLMVPFAPRLAERAFAVPFRQGAGVSMDFRTPRAFSGMRVIFDWSDSRNARNLCGAWRDGWKKLPLSKKEGEITRWMSVREGSAAYRVGCVDKWTQSWQAKHHMSLSSPLSRESAQVLAKLYAPYFVECEEKIVKGLVLPLASSRVFYGAVWLMMITPGGSNEETEELARDLGRCLGRVIDRTYLPVLALLHEHWVERLQVGAWRQPTGAGRRGSAESGSGAVSEAFSVEGPTGRKGIYHNVYLRLSGVEDKVPMPSSVVRTDVFESLFARLWKWRHDGGARDEESL
ncbi:MAG: hypothetical protein ABIH26_12790, partial [Candidatus Eisenbacteria bacterium]